MGGRIMKKMERIYFLMLLSIVFYLQAILSLLLWNYVSWFWLESYMWIAVITASILFVLALIEAKFGVSN